MLTGSSAAKYFSMCHSNWGARRGEPYSLLGACHLVSLCCLTGNMFNGGRLVGVGGWSEMQWTVASLLKWKTSMMRSWAWFGWPSPLSVLLHDQVSTSATSMNAESSGHFPSELALELYMIDFIHSLQCSWILHYLAYGPILIYSEVPL